LGLIDKLGIRAGKLGIRDFEDGFSCLDEGIDHKDLDVNSDKLKMQKNATLR
jgi:hypothetical protein